MPIKINLLHVDRQIEDKYQETMMFIASMGGVVVGSMIVFAYIIAERACGIVL